MACFKITQLRQISENIETDLANSHSFKETKIFYLNNIIINKTTILCPYGQKNVWHLSCFKHDMAVTGAFIGINEKNG